MVCCSLEWTLASRASCEAATCFDTSLDATRRVARTALKLNQIKAVANEQRKSTAKQSCRYGKGRTAISHVSPVTRRR